MVVGIDEQRFFECSLANEQVASPRQHLVVLATILTILKDSSSIAGPAPEAGMRVLR
jgi:hypothetical protein